MDELTELLSEERCELVARALRIGPLDTVEDVVRRIHALGLVLTGPEAVPPHVIEAWLEGRDDQAHAPQRPRP